ncbi:uncharacterized protein LOC121660522 [Corvus kubaryi]|uniref:uncharacterized protein LOC121660522 n=1 Tax=Corvus kubaryi TaxID=68294 RepID=UPI001C03C5E4|nr:uncharacterized protein LOC121660522 [Corvus kubaryi]
MATVVPQLQPMATLIPWPWWSHGHGGPMATAHGHTDPMAMVVPWLRPMATLIPWPQCSHGHTDPMATVVPWLRPMATLTPWPWWSYGHADPTATLIHPVATLTPWPWCSHSHADPVATAQRSRNGAEDPEEEEEHPARPFPQGFSRSRRPPGLLWPLVAGPAAGRGSPLSPAPPALCHCEAPPRAPVPSRCVGSLQSPFPACQRCCSIPSAPQGPSPLGMLGQSSSALGWGLSSITDPINSLFFNSPPTPRRAGAVGFQTGLSRALSNKLTFIFLAARLRCSLGADSGWHRCGSVRDGAPGGGFGLAGKRWARCSKAGPGARDDTAGIPAARTELESLSPAGIS